jgi:hypothetical protein
MSIAETGALLKFMPFSAMLRDGLDRMFDIVKSEKFHSFVNGECYESTFTEAVLISPRVQDILRNDRNCRVFVISDEDINSQYFGDFFEFICRRDCFSLSEGKELSFLSIRRFSGNERLILILLASHHSMSDSNRNSISVSQSTSTASSPSSETVSSNMGCKKRNRPLSRDMVKTQTIF